MDNADNLDKYFDMWTFSKKKAYFAQLGQFFNFCDVCLIFSFAQPIETLHDHPRLRADICLAARLMVTYLSSTCVAGPAKTLMGHLTLGSSRCNTMELINSEWVTSLSPTQVVASKAQDTFLFPDWSLRSSMCNTMQLNWASANNCLQLKSGYQRLNIHLSWTEVWVCAFELTNIRLNWASTGYVSNSAWSIKASWTEVWEAACVQYYVIELSRAGTEHVSNSGQGIKRFVFLPIIAVELRPSVRVPKLMLGN